MRVCILIGCLFVNSVFGLDKRCSTLYTNDSHINWEVNYVVAIEKAKKENKMLLVLFCYPPATDLCCEQARIKFLNNDSFLLSFKEKFVFCVIEPKQRPTLNAIHIQFLSLLLKGASTTLIKLPSFVVINPSKQDVNSGIIPALLDDEVITKLFNINTDKIMSCPNP